MNHLLRSHAPISDAGWKMLDEEARGRLAPALAARKLVDFSGPLGWEHSAMNLGRTRPMASAPSRNDASAAGSRSTPLAKCVIGPRRLSPSFSACSCSDRAAGSKSLANCRPSSSTCTPRWPSSAACLCQRTWKATAF